MNQVLQLNTNKDFKKQYEYYFEWNLIIKLAISLYYIMDSLYYEELITQSKLTFSFAYLAIFKI